jgi:tetratricopeptide (TPR) repeat protein
MKTLVVYKSLIILAFPAALVSFQDAVMAAPAAQSPGIPAAKVAPAPAAIFSTAEASFKKGDYAAVTDLLWKHIDSLDRKSLILLAVAHEKKKEPANMLKVATLLSAKDPKDYEALYLLGTAQFMSKKSTEALESLKASLEINPKYEPAYEKLAQMYAEKKNTYELRILYQDMVDKIGKKPAYLNKLCEINAVLDYQEDQALSYCKEAIGKDPKNADNYVYMGIVQKNGGNAEEAKKSLKSAADAHSKSEFAQYTYANLLEEQKNYLEASKYYLAGTAADATAARSWIGYAKTSFEVHKFEPALDAYKKACKLDKKNAVAFRKATTILRNTKDAAWVKPYETASDACSGY